MMVAAEGIIGIIDTPSTANMLIDFLAVKSAGNSESKKAGRVLRRGL